MITGASTFSFRSPVRTPTFSAPKVLQNWAWMLLVSAFSGEAYQDFPPPAKTFSMAFSAIQVFPEPVGAQTRQSPFPTASTAAIWKGSATNGFFSGVPIFSNTGFSLASDPGWIRFSNFRLPEWPSGRLLRDWGAPFRKGRFCPDRDGLRDGSRDSFISLSFCVKHARNMAGCARVSIGAAIHPFLEKGQAASGNGRMPEGIRTRR